MPLLPEHGLCLQTYGSFYQNARYSTSVENLAIIDLILFLLCKALHNTVSKSALKVVIITDEYATVFVNILMLLFCHLHSPKLSSWTF